MPKSNDVVVDELGNRQTDRIEMLPGTEEFGMPKPAKAAKLAFSRQPIEEEIPIKSHAYSQNYHQHQAMSRYDKTVKRASRMKGKK